MQILHEQLCRRISVLPVISKLFERLLSVQLRDYLKSKNVLSPQQHGFRPFRSCQTALISLKNRLFTIRTDRHYSAVVSLDFSKAFDCFDHESFLTKLHKVGISALSLSWFRSYLLSATACKIHQCIFWSAACYCRRAVYVDLNCSACTLMICFPACLRKVARRTQTILPWLTRGRTAQEARDSLQKLLDIVCTWSKVNSLTLNISKCNVIFISPQLRRVQSCHVQPVALNGHNLTVVDRMTLLNWCHTHQSAFMVCPGHARAEQDEQPSWYFKTFWS